MKVIRETMFRVLPYGIHIDIRSAADGNMMLKMRAVKDLFVEIQVLSAHGRWGNYRARLVEVRTRDGAGV